MVKGFSLRTATKLRMAAETVFTVSPASVLNYIRYKITKPQREIRLSRCGFVSASILVNRRCNLSCPWCINGALPPVSGLQDFDLDAERMKRLLLHQAIRRCLYIGLTGGEPLLNNNIADIIRLARRHGHIVGIVTNGILLVDRIRELKESRVNQISVSVYNTNIKALCDILPKVNTILPVRTTAIIQRSELEDAPGKIEEIIRLSCESGCRGTVLTFLFPHGVESDELVYDDNHAYRDFKRRITEKYPDYQLYWPAPLARTPLGKDKRCRMPWFFLIVDAKGDVGFCCNYPPDTTGIHWNLFDDPSGDVFNISQACELRAGILSGSSGVPNKCRGCFIMGDRWLSNV